MITCITMSWFRNWIITWNVAHSLYAMNYNITWIWKWMRTLCSQWIELDWTGLDFSFHLWINVVCDVRSKFDCNQGMWIIVIKWVSSCLNDLILFYVMQIYKDVSIFDISRSAFWWFANNWEYLVQLDPRDHILI